MWRTDQTFCLFFQEESVSLAGCCLWGSEVFSRCKAKRAGNQVPSRFGYVEEVSSKAEEEYGRGEFVATLSDLPEPRRSGA